MDVVQNLFSESPDDFVISINETDIAVIKTLTEGGDGKEIYRIAKSIEDALAQNLKIKVTIGIGTVVSHIRDLARAYKEAGVAIDVGKVFDTEKTIITYENLGIGRLIYQLPTVMCEMFLQEVFKKNPIDALDQETLFTINKFFENNLNVSETARKLFVHRNTLVYRLEKIKKLTGLDLRSLTMPSPSKWPSWSKSTWCPEDRILRRRTTPWFCCVLGGRAVWPGEFNSSGNRALPAMCSVHFPGCGKTACRGPAVRAMPAVQRDPSGQITTDKGVLF